MKKLKPTNLIAVFVPEDLINISVTTKRDDIKVEYIGTITADSIFDFDASKYVSKGSYATTFCNYETNDNHKSNQLNTAEESFISLLKANDIVAPKGMKILIIEKQ